MATDYVHAQHHALCITSMGKWAYVYAWKRRALACSEKGRRNQLICSSCNGCYREPFRFLLGVILLLLAKLSMAYVLVKWRADGCMTSDQ